MITTVSKQIWLSIISVIVLSLATSVASASEKADLKDIDLPRFQILPGMEVAWVAEKIGYNGLPVSIQNFKSRDSVKDLFFKYESKWKFKGFNQVVRSRNFGMKVLGIKEPSGVYYTVQARDTANGGSEGSLVVSMSPLETAVDTKTDFPLYPNSEVISKIESLDSDIRAETLTVLNNSSVNGIKYWYKSTMSRNGWQEQDTPDANFNKDAVTLTFQNQRQLCQITIIGNSPDYDGKTVILIHWMK